MRPIFLIISFFLLPHTAFAADLGQYRKGTPYQSVIAAGADICENHCAGDALCRSWNYVKVNPQALGVCEFNSNDVSPVPSAISISGSNVGNIYRSNVIRGGVNTVRIGTEVIKRPRTVEHPTSSRRMVVREDAPVAKTSNDMPTHHQARNLDQDSLTAQQNRHRSMEIPSRPRAPLIKAPYSEVQNPAMIAAQHTQHPLKFQHDLGGRLVPVASSQPAMPGRPHNFSNSAQYRRHHQGPTSHRVAQQQRTVDAPNFVQSSAIKPQGLVRDVRRAGPEMKQRDLGGKAHPISMAPQQTMIRRPASNPAKMGDVEATNEQVKPNLFGKLNDDVINVPNSGSSIPNDPELPISTASSRPTQRVEQSYLGDLAGGPG